MPFKAQSYYRNKAKREALEYLATARRLKALNPGQAHADIASAVRLARSNWRTYQSYRRLDECDVDLKKRLSGKMSHVDFMTKWGSNK